MTTAYANRLRMAMVAVALLFLTACASTSAPVYSVPEGDWKARITTQSKSDIKVSAAVPSADLKEKQTDNPESMVNPFFYKPGHWISNGGSG